MKIAEILEIENANTDNINLFKEGIFWRVYEKSAWRFVKNIREYRVFKKYVKTVEQNIVYLGFPDSVLPEILSSAETRHTSEHKSEIFVEIQGFTDTDGFEVWKEEIEFMNCKENKQDEIIQKIKEYPIGSKTPVEAFKFLAELQNELKVIKFIK